MHFEDHRFWDLERVRGGCNRPQFIEGIHGLLAVTISSWYEEEVAETINGFDAGDQGAGTC